MLPPQGQETSQQARWIQLGMLYDERVRMYQRQHREMKARPGPYARPCAQSARFWRTPRLVQAHLLRVRKRPVSASKSLNTPFICSYAVSDNVRRPTNPRQRVARRPRTGPEPLACCYLMVEPPNAPTAPTPPHRQPDSPRPCSPPRRFLESTSRQALQRDPSFNSLLPLISRLDFQITFRPCANPPQAGCAQGPQAPEPLTVCYPMAEPPHAPSVPIPPQCHG